MDLSLFGGFEPLLSPQLAELAILVQRDPPPFDFKELMREILGWVFFAFVFGGPILSKIFGGLGKKNQDAEKELEARRRRAEALRRQAQAQERAMQQTESIPIPSQAAPAANAGEFGGLGSFGPEEAVERPWYEPDENALEGESAESVLERVGPPEQRKAVGVFDTTDVTSIDDLAPLATLAETQFESLASEFESRSLGSLLLKGTAAERRRKGVSRDSVRGSWRRAIVLREVLGTPAGMRSDREDLPGLR